MSLPFPAKPEIRLSNPPLSEVVCQVRFSPILRIAKEEPSEFQEQIRGRFPDLNIEQGFLFKVPGAGSNSAPTAETKPRLYRFRTADEQSSVSLAVDFYALSTNRYTHWGDFARDLSLVHEAMRRVYKPAYATRIGLRYVNRFTYANTQRTTNRELFDLFRPELTALLRAEQWTAPVEMLNQVTLKDDEAQLFMRSAFGDEAGDPFFLLDLDYATEGKLPLTDLIDRVNRYHNLIYRVFRWCLKDEVLELFQPLDERV